MGIPFYYSDLIKKYPDIKIKPNKIDILFFDYNGLIHPVAHDTVCKNTHENIFFNLLWKKTMDLVDNVKPNLTKIYIDGVAPLAKINQQRKRSKEKIEDWIRKPKIQKAINFLRENPNVKNCDVAKICDLHYHSIRKIRTIVGIQKVA